MNGRPRYVLFRSRRSINCYCKTECKIVENQSKNKTRYGTNVNSPTFCIYTVLIIVKSLWNVLDKIVLYENKMVQIVVGL